MTGAVRLFFSFLFLRGSGALRKGKGSVLVVGGGRRVAALLQHVGGS